MTISWRRLAGSSHVWELSTYKTPPEHHRTGDPLPADSGTCAEFRCQKANQENKSLKCGLPKALKWIFACYLSDAAQAETLLYFRVSRPLLRPGVWREVVPSLVFPTD